MGRRSLSEMGGPCSCASAAPEAGVQAADIVAGQDASTPSALLVNLFPWPSVFAVALLIWWDLACDL